MGRRSSKTGGNGTRLDPSTARIAIVGSGLTGLATALQLERLYGFAHVSVFETDDSLVSRREGYGLTLTYHPHGTLHQLGLLNDLAHAECPSRSHYFLDPSGRIRGYFGNAFANNNDNDNDRGGGWGQRGNLRVPRQRVRAILASQLRTTTIHWDHQLTGIQYNSTSAANNNQSTPFVNNGNVEHGRSDSFANGSGHALALKFSNGRTVPADILIAADGIRSTVVQLWLPMAPPPQSLGVRIILGLADLSTVTSNGSPHHELLQERGFYTLGPRHRLFVMPYSGSAFGRSLCANEPVRFMWQLSFAVDDDKTYHSNDSSRQQHTGEELLREALERTRSWHAPIQQLMEATPFESVWGCLLHDRDPTIVHHHWKQKQKLYEQQNYNTVSLPHVLVAGDALHAMSPFKGQGANQCFRDAEIISKRLHEAATTSTSLKVVIANAMRDMVQRTTPIVKASRAAAAYWHEPETWLQLQPFAGVMSSDRVIELVDALGQRCINAGTTLRLDETIRNVVNELRFSPDCIDDNQSCNEAQSKGNDWSDSHCEEITWANTVVQAASMGETCVLREISWSRPNVIRRLEGRLEENDAFPTTCLHAAAAAGHESTVHWLITEAGCDLDAMDRSGRTVLDVAAQHPSISVLLERLRATQIH